VKENEVWTFSPFPGWFIYTWQASAWRGPKNLSFRWQKSWDCWVLLFLDGEDKLQRRNANNKVEVSFKKLASHSFGKVFFLLFSSIAKVNKEKEKWKSKTKELSKY
jgi:hypothetical protein